MLSSCILEEILEVRSSCCKGALFLTASRVEGRGRVEGRLPNAEEISNGLPSSARREATNLLDSRASDLDDAPARSLLLMSWMVSGVLAGLSLTNSRFTFQMH